MSMILYVQIERFPASFGGLVALRLGPLSHHHQSDGF